MQSPITRNTGVLDWQKTVLRRFRNVILFEMSGHLRYMLQNIGRLCEQGRNKQYPRDGILENTPL